MNCVAKGSSKYPLLGIDKSKGSQWVLSDGTVVYENVRSPIIQLLGRAGKIISDNCSIFSIMPHSDQSFESSD